MMRHGGHLIISIVILTILLIPISNSSYRPTTSVSNENTVEKVDGNEIASDWIDGWQYRKAHQILGTPGAGENYQVELLVHYGSGLDTGNNIFCDTNCQMDFDDIRFTDNDGSTLLDFWRESYYTSDNATFWIEVQDSLDTDATIFVYYGNSTCTTTSNGTATFVFFDDFNDGIIDSNKWETYGPWIESGGFASFSITGTGGTSILPSLRTDNTWDMRNKSIVSNWRFVEKSVNREWGVSCADTIGDDHTKLSYFIANTNGTHNIFVLYYDVNSAPGYDFNMNPGPIWYEGVFHKTEFTSAPNADLKNQWLLNDEIINSYNDYTFDASPQYIFLGFYVYGYTNTLISGNLEMEFDYVYLRNNVGADVYHGSWSSTEEWLSGWNYRMSHSILGAADAGTNYQIEINVHYSYGINSGPDVYCEEKCQPDFDDIRFTDDDGVTLLDYWTESVVESNVSTFWVEVKDDLSVDTTIYMYYGNSTTTSLSNGSETFIAWDDFDEGYSSGDGPKASRGWSIVNQGADICRVENNPSGRDGMGLRYSEDGAGGLNLHVFNIWEQTNHDIAVHFHFNWVSKIEQFYFNTYDIDDWFPTVTLLSQSPDYDWEYYTEDTWVEYLNNLEPYEDLWYEIEQRTDMDDGEYTTLVINGTEYQGANNENALDGFDCVRFAAHADYHDDYFIDEFYVRKYVSSEPIHGAWGGLTTFSWHHNCSSTTGFVYSDAWNINWMTWDIQPGTLASDGTSLTISGIATGSGYHGPVYEYELPQTMRVRDIHSFSAIMDADNSLSSYLGYQVVMLGDANRNPILFFGFSDGWSDFSQGAYGISYVFENGSRVGFGSGYPVIWTSFAGEMNVSYNEAGLVGYVNGIGQQNIDGLSDADLNREVKYVALASSRFGSASMFPLLVDDISLNYESQSEVMIPEITGIDDFNYEAGQSGNLVNWAIANFNPITFELWRDGGLLTSGAWPGGSEIEFSVDYLSPGTYEYTIIVYGENDVVVSDSVIVQVTDLTPPSLGHPSDATYEYGSTGHTIVWTVSDLYPGNYSIFRDGTMIEFDEWTPGLISINTDGFNLGTYVYMIAVYDAYYNLVTDFVSITVVDTTAPILNHPSDIIGDLNLGEIQVTWQPTDLLPFSYEIYLNGTKVQTELWTSGENITYTFEPEMVGSYNITIIVRDTSGNSALDTVYITIDHQDIQPFGDVLIVSISVGSLAVIVVVIGMICRNKGGTAPQTSVPNDYRW